MPCWNNVTVFYRVEKLSASTDLPVLVLENFSVGDWLGTGNLSARERSKGYKSFQEARKFAIKIGFKGKDEWYEYWKSGKKPADIPYNPNQVYKKEWVSWGDFLGTGNISNVDKMYIPFKEARKFAIKLGLKSGNEWTKFAKENKNATIKTTITTPFLPQVVQMLMYTIICLTRLVFGFRVLVLVLMVAELTERGILAI